MDQDPQSHEVSKPMEQRFDAMNRRLCNARRSGSKELCRNVAMKGQNVCRNHGGAAKRAKKNAQLRLVSLVDPAIATLAKEMVNPDTTSGARQSAANSILDRAGWGRVTKVEAVDARAMLLQRLRELRDAAEESLELDAAEDLDIEVPEIETDVEIPDE
jgi:hypothetical protein